MDRHPLGNTDDELSADAPEDVAILYSWANLQGARYRDFSANRREYRAQVRLRAAEQDRLAELAAKSQAEAVASQQTAEPAVTQPEISTRPANLFTNTILPLAVDTAEAQQDRKVLLREAALQARNLAAERLEVARRAEAAALADSIARREERIVAETQASELRRAAQSAEADFRAKQSRFEQPPTEFSQILSRLHEAQSGVEDRGVETQPVVSPGPPVIDLVSSTFRQHRESMGREAAATPKSAPEYDAGPYKDPARISPERMGSMPGVATQVSKSSSRAVGPGAPERVADTIPSIPYRDFQRASSGSARSAQPEVVNRIPGSRNEISGMPDRDFELWDASGEVPAIPLADTFAKSTDRSVAQAHSPVERLPKQQAQPGADNGVADSNERISSRWVTLKGIFERKDRDHATSSSPMHEESAHRAVLAIFSLAGGVGRSSLVATLGRALSSLHERVLLIDTTPHGILPFHFGTSEVLPGVLRTFLPPPTSKEAPVDLISYALNHQADAHEQAKLIEDILHKSQHSSRIILDMNEGSEWLLGRLARFRPTVLVPLLADMNSVISLKAVEAIFTSMEDDAGEPLQPFYLLNQFDASLPLHLEVHEMLKQRLGSRLLPFVVRRAAAVGEALAAGITVLDYEPGSPGAQDYQAVAKWMHEVAAPAEVGDRSPRWSER